MMCWAAKNILPRTKRLRDLMREHPKHEVWVDLQSAWSSRFILELCTLGIRTQSSFFELQHPNLKRRSFLSRKTHRLLYEQSRDCPSNCWSRHQHNKTINPRQSLSQVQFFSSSHHIFVCFHNTLELCTYPERLQISWDNDTEESTAVSLFLN